MPKKVRRLRESYDTTRRAGGVELALAIQARLAAGLAPEESLEALLPDTAARWRQRVLRSRSSATLATVLLQLQP